MAAVSLGVSLTSTTDGTSFTTGAFTPAANDLLVACIVGTNCTVVGTVTGSASLTFTNVTSAVYNAGVHEISMFVCNQLAAASSQTVTWDSTGDSASGCGLVVLRLSGMTKTGAAAIRQSKVTSNGAAAGTPAVTFDASALTGNPTIGMVGNSTQPAGLTAPTNWTENVDTGYLTPATGIETVSRNSGFTGTTITWGSASATVFAAIIAEFDASGNSTTIANSLMMMGVGT